MKDNFKLLQVGPYPPPLGGWSFHIQVFQRYLNEQGVDNLVLDIGENRRQAGRDCIPVKNGLELLWKLFRFIREGYCPYLHFNGNPIKGMLLVFLGQLVALLCGRRCLLSFHAGVVQKCFAPGFNVQKILCFCIFSLGDGVICNSDDVKKKICTFFSVSDEKVYSIPCFSRQYIQHEKILLEGEKRFLERHNPVICSYLFFREEYDPVTLLGAMEPLLQRYPDLGLVLIGTSAGSGRYVDDLSKQVKEHIFLAGEKEHEGFLSLVEECDLMIRTPLSDGVSSSLMEALALGIPVLACDNETRPEEVQLYCFADRDDLVQKTMAIIEHLDEYKNALQHFEPRDAILEEYQFLQRYWQEK